MHSGSIVFGILWKLSIIVVNFGVLARLFYIMLCKAIKFVSKHIERKIAISIDTAFSQYLRLCRGLLVRP